jgi:hypothetical protein
LARRHCHLQQKTRLAQKTFERWVTFKICVNMLQVNCDSFKCPWIKF